MAGGRPGRKQKILDFQLIGSLAKILCTEEEIADICQTTVETLHRACKRQLKQEFSDFYKQASAHSKASLRRVQLSTALKGNVTMLIWLGKQWLNQTESAVPVEVEERKPVMLAYSIARTA